MERITKRLISSYLWTFQSWRYLCFLYWTRREERREEEKKTREKEEIIDLRKTSLFFIENIAIEKLRKIKNLNQRVWDKIREKEKNNK